MHEKVGHDWFHSMVCLFHLVVSTWPILEELTIPKGNKHIITSSRPNLSLPESCDWSKAAFVMQYLPKVGT